MMGNKEIPNREQLRDFGHAVAGHAGTMSDESGELFIKPCVRAEVDFYHSANQLYPDFAYFMPLFMGTLNLSDPSEVDVAKEVTGLVKEAGGLETSSVQIAAAIAEQVASAVPQPASAPSAGDSSWAPKTKSKKIDSNEAIVLENTSHGFTQPNILDAKLGIRLWADDAPEAKKQRFDKISADTTHAKLGFRVAGMRVYRGSEDASQLDENDYRVYDKDYGRKTVNEGNIASELRNFVFNKAAGIDEELGQAVCAGFARDLARVQKVLERHESRMYSASLLFVFEGDGSALRSAIREQNAAIDAARADKIERTTKRVDSGIVLEAEDDSDVDGIEVDVDSDLELSSLPQIYRLKLIDFAHAQWTPKQGPDENVLVGVRSLRKLFRDMAQ